MTAEDYLSDPWYEQFIPVPSCLQATLRHFGNARRFDLAHAIGQELGLRTSDASLSTWQIILAFLPHLEAAVKHGKVMLDERPILIAQEVVKGRGVQDCTRALVELGWGKTRVATSIDDLTTSLRAELARHLVPRIQAMFARWEAKGVLS